MKSIKSEIIGCGHYLPEQILTNDDLSKMVDTSDEWIVTRTGIKSRHIKSGGEFTSDLAYNAAKNALENAKIAAKEIDMLIVATITPDNTTPSVACKVATRLGLRVGVPAFDISAACSGFVYALSIADSFIRTKQAKNMIVVGAETLSNIVDWQDRNTCVLFGDGAGAVVLSAKSADEDNLSSGIIMSKIYSDGTCYDSLHTDGGVSMTQTAGNIIMNGKEVFKNAVHCLTEGAKAVLEDAGMSVDEVDWLLPHQANIRIIEATGKMLDIPEEKVIVAIENSGNTSAASIPIALSQNIQSGKIKKGGVVLLTAMGAGFTWGASLIRL